MKQISATRAIVDGELVGPTCVTWEASGLITQVESISAQDAEFDLLLTPGFIDVQVNGVGEIDIATAVDDEWLMLDRLLLNTGVTSWCPTLISAPLSSMAKSLESISAQMQKPRSCAEVATTSIIGAHLEGPFLGSVSGAHDLRSIIPIDLKWIRQLPPCVKLMTVGAEQKDVVGAIHLLNSQGITVSIGHTRASDTEFLAAKDAGATVVTHLFNAMSGVHHRDPGVALTTLTDDDMYASIIVDLEHVSWRAVQLAFRAKRDRMILVTDSVKSSGTSAHRLRNGTLAGSALRMDQALRNTVIKCAVPQLQAIAAATSNPASVLRLLDRGEIAVGKRADLVLLSDKFEVFQTISGGLLHTND